MSKVVYLVFLVVTALHFNREVVSRVVQFEEASKNDVGDVDTISTDVKHWHRPDGYGLAIGLAFIWICYGGAIWLGVIGGDRLLDGRRGGWPLIVCSACLIYLGGVSTVLGPPWLW